MQTVRELLASVTVGDVPVKNLDAELLLAHCLDQPRTFLYSRRDRPVGDEVAAVFSALARERRDGVPLAYLLGVREFWSLTLSVNRHTLVPRADTETLVQWALELNLSDSSRVLDLGTGSGAIALALASEKPDWSITGTDISAEALKVAGGNARDLGLGQVTFLQSNWFQTLRRRPFELVVSNPPYIAIGDPHLSADGVRCEPEIALVSGEDGLEDIRHLIEGVGGYLGDDAWLLLEHGCDQAARVRALLRDAGFEAVATRRDLAGNERVSGGMCR